jgi:hypothetical protein
MTERTFLLDGVAPRGAVVNHPRITLRLTPEDYARVYRLHRPLSLEVLDLNTQEQFLIDRGPVAEGAARWVPNHPPVTNHP